MADQPLPVGATARALLARIDVLAARARRDGREATFRCPTCRDTGWVFRNGTTDGGHHDIECAHRCAGPTVSGCLYNAWRKTFRSEPVTAGRTRGMD